MTSTMGIMTLSRGPCDLDNMSLFQDLKLKRRKVDSRCSSDGGGAGGAAGRAGVGRGLVQEVGDRARPSDNNDRKQSRMADAARPPPAQ
ncbi:hypothetical protein JYU34_010912 [Plutella xylostella]|uniref:Uncharacterized protein n=1 Tax=Plutella xylostella TaxID=51655 RepID=A0ABQ7QFL4_PLUXY|nr:hypothetical protein JYU34_010912 [Plutella xylostella]